MAKRGRKMSGTEAQPLGDWMNDVYKRRWLFILEGRVEIKHILDEQGNMIGMSLETDLEILDCYSPDEVTVAIDRLMQMENLSGSIH